MPVTSVDKDPESRTMTITAEYDAPVEQCWKLWSDPRRLERWWGPPTYPATFVDHDLTPGACVSYFMTGPDGDKAHGWWRVLAVEAPHRLEFEDGFGDEPGNAGDLPLTRIRVALEAKGDGTRLTIASVFPSIEAMEQLIAMGMDEGMSEAMGQIDALLASA